MGCCYSYSAGTSDHRCFFNRGPWWCWWLVGLCPCCQWTGEKGAASGAYILQQVAVASAMGDLESVAGILDFTSEMSCFLWTRFEKIPVNYSMQPSIKDVDKDAPWFAWCGHSATLPFTWPRSYFSADHSCAESPSTRCSLLLSGCPLVCHRDVDAMNWGSLRSARLDRHGLSANLELRVRDRHLCFCGYSKRHH